MEISRFLLLSLVGGLVGLDGASVGQVMLSRPLVAAVLAGWVLGDPVTGLAVGVLVELFLLPVFPVGGGRFPEGGPATVAGVAAALQAGGGAEGLAFGVLVGLAGAQLGGVTVLLVRRANGYLVPDPDQGRFTSSAVVRAHLTGILMDFGRGVVLVAALTGLVVRVGRWAGESWPLSPSATGGILMAGAAISLGALLRAIGGWEHRRALFLSGLALGLAVAALTP